MSDDALLARIAVLRAKVAMYEGWLREHVPDCELLAENIACELNRDSDSDGPRGDA